LVFGAVLLGYQLLQPEQGQKIASTEVKISEKTVTEIDTSNWQTYRNDEFGFEVRYPSTFVISGNFGDAVLFRDTSGDTVMQMSLANGIKCPSDGPKEQCRVAPTKEGVDITFRYFDIAPDEATIELSPEVALYSILPCKNSDDGIANQGVSFCETLLERTLFEQILSTFKFLDTQTEKLRLLDILLRINAPFSTATLTIEKNGSVYYVAKQRGQEEIQDSGTFFEFQISALIKLIQDTNILEMKDRLKEISDPEDGSTYTIIVRILPQGPPEFADPAIYSVSCYQFNCENGFVELKNKIIELWGQEVMEIGV